MKKINWLRKGFGFISAFVLMGAAGPHAVPGAGGTSDDELVLSSYFVPEKDGPVMDRVAREFEVRARHADGFEVIVPARRAKELLHMAPRSRLLEKDLSDAFRRVEMLSPGAFAGYRSFAEIESHARGLEKRFPNLVKVETYGTSQGGKTLFAIKVSDNVQEDEDEVELMLTSATHGDEIATPEVLLNLLDSLVQNYESDARMKKMVDERELYFIPVVNPDGFVKRNRYSNGVDPNREYPYPARPDRNPNACIRNLIAFFNAHDFKGTIDFHSHGRLFMYPWAYTRETLEGEDFERVDSVARSMAETNGYLPGQISHILYAAPGSSADFYHWKKRTVSLGVEIGTTTPPPASQLPALTRENTESTWRYIESF